MTLAAGSRDKRWSKESRRITVAFDPETFEQVQRLALKNKQTVTVTLRDLVEWGLEDHAHG